jgi:hypothetical protein
MRATMRPASVPLAGLLLALGCAHAPASSAPGARPTGAAARRAAADVAAFTALAVGNQWTWEDQSPSLPAGRSAAARQIKIVGRTADGYYQDDQHGELKLAGGCLQDRVRRLLCGPLEVGTTWKSVVSVSSTEKYEIVGVGETVTVPAGTFPGCVRVRAVNPGAPGTELVGEITYAPGVGAIRIETLAVFNGAATPQLKAALRSYRLEGK